MDMHDLRRLQDICRARDEETLRVGDLIYEAVALADDEKVIDALVSLAWKVLGR